MVAWAGVERLNKGLVDNPHTVRYVPSAHSPSQQRFFVALCQERFVLNFVGRFHPRWPLDRSGALTAQQLFPGISYKRPHKSTLYDP